MYEYLIGALVFGVPWLFLFFKRRDLRWPMLWTSGVYIVFSGIIVALWSFVQQFVFLGTTIVPHYWHPPTFFNLGMTTGFAGIEDVLWLVFIGGVATCVYEFLSGKRIKVQKKYTPHLRAFVVALFAFFIFQYLFQVNLIYGFIVSNFCGAFSLWVERRDLVRHSLLGASAFFLVYLVAFLVCRLIFPTFVTDFYVLEHLISFSFLGIPAEELLYALSFGLMWAPMYEYAHGEKCVDKH